VAVVKPGRVLYEMGGMDAATATAAFKLAAAKLPLMTRIVNRSEQSL
jgi:large subunit ribosomal protein L16